MERQISVGIFRQKYVDHLQRWSRIFRSEETETDLSIWIPTEISGIFGIMESTLWKGSPVFPLEIFRWNCVFHLRVSQRFTQGGKKAGRWNGQSALGPMCDAEKDWHERSFHASGAINGCQKSPLDKPEMTFSFFIFKLPVTSF